MKLISESNLPLCRSFERVSAARARLIMARIIFYQINGTMAIFNSFKYIEAVELLLCADD